ncbi:hypothetical protein ACJIZ3_003685 [Penstemon smallii]|uniref:WW domain-containing protein n=1 Tax=Penstemon smallii TaxID=265156 RepID=A0ABD3UB84_9LAMI
MATPNMATITASLERSFQNCSLNHQLISSSNRGGGGAAPPESPENQSLDATPTLELYSQAPLPYNWEQCLDLKTSEIYYINWRTGMKAKEDPRTTAGCSGDYYSEDGGSGSSSYDSEGSCSESCPPFSRDQQQWSGNSNNNEEKSTGNDNEIYNYNDSAENGGNVLVVGGCKSCLMYYMVPKQLQICPKCCGQLLHFDRSI